MAATRGSQMLSATGVSARKLAAACAVDERTARAWIRAEKTPSSNAQQALQSAYAVPLAAWGERPHGAAAPATAPAPPTATAPSAPSLEDSARRPGLVSRPASAPPSSDEPPPDEPQDAELASIRTTAPRFLPVPATGFGRDVINAAELTRKLIADLNGPAGAELDMLTRSKLLSQATQTLQRLGAQSCDNLAGLTKEQFLTSPTMTAIAHIMGNALRPWPAALRACAAALMRSYSEVK